MLNKVMMIGRLGADPEVRNMPSGDAITTIRLATTRRWRDRNTNERKEETEWHRVVFFSRLAKVAGEYLKKGSQVYVEGRIKTDKYQKDGQDIYRTGIIGEALNMLDSRSGKASSEPGNGANQSGGNSEPSYDDFDDIPFDSLNWQIRRHLI